MLIDTSKPRVMGVLNLTPDSFSDGGRYTDVSAAVARAEDMLREGADIIDIGGESTRPGAEPVSVDQELARVVPVIVALRSCTDVLLSIDTSKPEVMREALAAGANIVNDVNALRAEGAMQAVVDGAATVCLMHMQGEPRSMQAGPIYQDVVTEVVDFLQQRIAACLTAGVCEKRIWVDPGFGFGKTLQHNYQLLAGLAGLGKLACPVLVGMSRKSMLGAVTGREASHRVSAGVTAGTLALQAGASIIRTHDVAATADAVKVWEAMNRECKA